MAEIPGVYLDACCFIEVVKFDENVALDKDRINEVWYIKRLLQAHRDREINVYTSAISIAEATHVGQMPVPAEVQRKFDSLLTSGQYVHLVQPTPFVCRDARNLRWRDGIALKGADTVHLASALDRDCAEFHSLDGRFDRVSQRSEEFKKKGLIVTQPSGTNALPGKYFQEGFWDDKPTH